MASTQEYAATKVMFSNNVQATLSVKLINGDGEDPAQSDVNVPEAATEMEITAYLMDYDSVSPDDEIANGSVVFLVKDSGVSEKKPISGKYGSIEVNVVWG
uniref:Uncharacterized protein n=1 Tax=Chenopodium quinoa TaxID=63459 RepID=A0A803MQD7_CHEQI